MKLFAKLLRVISKVTSKLALGLEPPVPPPPPEVPKIPTEKELAYERWIKEDGDNTYRLNYDLAPSDIIVDLGGYKGQWASDIYSRYLCKVHIFEPVRDFAQLIKARYKMNPDIQVYDHALGAETGEMTIFLDENATSSFKNSGKALTSSVIDFEAWLQASNINEIALLKVNIEGGEYDLLEHLIDTKIVKRIRNIQVQFHDFVPNSALRAKRIRDRLRIGHKLTYQYTFIWENWQRIDIQD